MSVALNYLTLYMKGNYNDKGYGRNHQKHG